MGFPATAMFPGAIWDGSSPVRSLAKDKEPPLVVHREPMAADWSQAQAEIIAMQTRMGTGAISGVAATTGYGYMPAVAGKPTGTPAGVPAGMVAFCYDKTNHKLSVFDVTWLQSVALS